jgi:hypothetical protein
MKRDSNVFQTAVAMSAHSLMYDLNNCDRLVVYMFTSFNYEVRNAISYCHQNFIFTTVSLSAATETTSQTLDLEMDFINLLCRQWSGRLTRCEMEISD